jgi:hypothetical protein
MKSRTGAVARAEELVFAHLPPLAARAHARLVRDLVERMCALGPVTNKFAGLSPPAQLLELVHFAMRAVAALHDDSEQHERAFALLGTQYFAPNADRRRVAIEYLKATVADDDRRRGDVAALDRWLDFSALGERHQTAQRTRSIGVELALHFIGSAAAFVIAEASIARLLAQTRVDDFLVEQVVRQTRWQNRVAALEALTRHTLQRHYAELSGADNAAMALFEGVLERQAKLIAQWVCVGFVHGVMNTDNMALSGETIDYGPCAFIDTYDPAMVFSSIDRGGRYAYGNQPNIAHWNLARLAEALLPLIDDDKDKAVAAVEGVLDKFPDRFRAHYTAGLRAKLGLLTDEETDYELAKEFLDWMKESEADFTSSFSALTKRIQTWHAEGPLSFGGAPMRSWLEKWDARLERQQKSKGEVVGLMRRANPVVIPRNYRVEEALSAAAAGNFSAMHRLLDALRNPFEETATNEPYREAPLPGGQPYRTFCGT